MYCERCGKREGEWQCQVCRRVICSQCARPTPGGVFCADDAPKKEVGSAPSERFARPEGSNPARTLFFTLLVLTLGVAGILFVADRFIFNTSIAQVSGLVGTFKNVGTMIMAGLAALTALMFIAYMLTRRK